MKVYVSVNGNKVVGYSHTPEQSTFEYEANEDFLNNPYKYKFENEKIVLCEDLNKLTRARKSNREYKAFLDTTDWMVQRHRDQKDLGIETSLTNEEFSELLQKRQEAREAIVNKI